MKRDSEIEVTLRKAFSISCCHSDIVLKCWVQAELTFQRFNSAWRDVTVFFRDFSFVYYSKCPRAKFIH